MLQILLIISQVALENKNRYDHDTVQIWKVTLTYNQQLSWLFTIFQQDSQTFFCFSKYIAGNKPTKRPADDPGSQHSA